MVKKALFIFLLLISFQLPLWSDAIVADSAKGVAANGLTGIICTPSARIGWESKDFGLDSHFSFFYRPDAVFMPTATFSIFRIAEVAIAMEFDVHRVNNLLFNAKLQFFKEGGAALAAGANLELSDLYTGDPLVHASAFFIATYSGNFFTMPAVTSVLIGWQFLENGDFNLDFNYSMGFELGLFPEVFRDYLFWITDFGNYSYAQRPFSGINATNRGALNTGLRIDLLKHENLKLQFDVIGTDLLDEERGFMASVTLGFGV